MWTLAEAFDYYNEERHYSNCFLTTRLEIGSDSRNLGVGSIKSSISNGAGLQSNTSVVPSANKPSPELASNVSAVDAST